MSQPAAGTPASTGVTTSGHVLGTTLLVSALGAGALSDVTRDTLLLAQREAPTTQTLSTWLTSYAEVLQQVGWLQTSTVSTTLELDDRRPAGTAGRAPTALPWEMMRGQLGQILTGPVSLSTVDGFVRGLSELSGDARSRWAASTVLGSDAICVVAVAAPAADGAVLTLCAGALTYTGGSAPAHLTGFPGAPVPVTGATLSLTGAGYALAPAVAAAGQDQLNELVSAVLPRIANVRSAS